MSIDLASGVFGLLQIVAFVELVRSHVPSKQFQQLLFASVIAAGVLGALAIVGLTYKGWIAPWTGRFYSLWDTGYAKKCVIVSVLRYFLHALPQVHPDYRFCIRTPTYCVAILLYGPPFPYLPLSSGGHPVFQGTA
jgi:dolichyl-diphosphooligosaccharide--protein glycosyltransferase